MTITEREARAAACGRDALGANPFGYINYPPDGRLTVFVLKSGRPKPSANPPHTRRKACAVVSLFAHVGSSARTGRIREGSSGVAQTLNPPGTDENAMGKPAAVTQDYPSKAVRIIEPFGAGGGPDLLARALAPTLSKLWGQPVTVENHPGAGATAAPALVAKSPPDGYTLLLNTSAQAYTAALSNSPPYDPLKDFIPVAALTTQPYVLVAGRPAGVTT